MRTQSILDAKLLDYSDNWKFHLQEDLSFDLPIPIDNYENEWVIIEDNQMTVKAPFFWDGCTPKFRIFGKLIGTPDGPIDPDTGLPTTYYASLAHDVLCLFEDICTPEEADEIFLLLMPDFKYRKLYYYAVRAFHLIKGDF